MNKLKYKFEETSSSPSRTKLTFPEKLERVPIELPTFLDDDDAKIAMDKRTLMVTVESSLLSEEEIDNAVQRCLSGLDLVCFEKIKSTF